MRDERGRVGDERDRALEAWARFRDSGEVRSADVSCLLSGARRIEQDSARERRREALLHRAATHDGLDRDFAELVYAMALEEGVEPAFAFELVRCGVGVLQLDEIVYDESPDEETMTTSAPPDELLATAPPDDEVVRRERRLRLSFRRLRSHIEASATPEDALVAFASEPDVGRCAY